MSDIALTFTELWELLTIHNTVIPISLVNHQWLIAHLQSTYSPTEYHLEHYDLYSMPAWIEECKRREVSKSIGEEWKKGYSLAAQESKLVIVPKKDMTQAIAMLKLTGMTDEQIKTTLGL